MSKTVLKSIYTIIVSVAIVVSITVFAGAANKAGTNDTVDLKNGDKVTGTVLNDTFTVSTPYSAVTLKKDKIAEIRFQSGNQNDDVVVLIAGGSVEGTIDEPAISLKLDSGKIISIEKEQCGRIILKRKTE
jgi:hypothetical protein